MIRTILHTSIAGLRPLLGPASCYYPERCTRFALRQLQETSIFVALYRIIKRVVSCNPLYAYLYHNKLSVVFALLLVSSLSPLFAMAIISPVYSATNCNGELIRNRAFITAFLPKLSRFIGLTPKGAPEVDWDQTYGFIGIQKVVEGGTITLTTFNRTNTLYVNLFAPHFASYPSKEITGFIKEHFKATGNS